MAESRWIIAGQSSGRMCTKSSPSGLATAGGIPVITAGNHAAAGRWAAAGKSGNADYRADQTEWCDAAGIVCAGLSALSATALSRCDVLVLYRTIARPQRCQQVAGSVGAARGHKTQRTVWQRHFRVCTQSSGRNGKRDGTGVTLG